MMVSYIVGGLLTIAALMFIGRRTSGPCANCGRLADDPAGHYQCPICKRRGQTL